MKKIKINLIVILLIVALGIFTLYPVQEKINLGLDLKGGIDVVYEIDISRFIESKIKNETSRIIALIKENDVYDDQFSVDHDIRENDLYESEIKVTFFEDLAEDTEKSEEVTQAILQAVQFLSKKSSAGNSFVLGVNRQTTRKYLDSAIDEVVRISRFRLEMDGVGLGNTTVSKTDKNRMRVQIPGMNAEQVAQKLEEIGELTFKLVREDNGFAPSVDQKTKLGSVGAGEEVIYGQRDPETGNIPVYVLEARELLKGTHLEQNGIRVGQDELGKPTVDFSLNDKGKAIFSKITSENVGRQLAIIYKIDGKDKVISAPAIQGHIYGGTASITGNFTNEFAQNLTTILKSGALPVPIKRISKIEVGPSLGAESIRKGVYAASIGGLIVFIYMLIIYKGSGLIADTALVLNVLLLMAGMALFKATLTLPGIAGIILTIGISVDANVIIFERIKEELRAGKSTGASIEGGFDKAFSTILDSNVTTIITALVLFAFGTGPVKGFAVTLTMGTVINLFTAVFVVRTIFNILTHGFNMKRLSI